MYRWMADVPEAEQFYDDAMSMLPGYYEGITEMEAIQYVAAIEMRKYQLEVLRARENLFVSRGDAGLIRSKEMFYFKKSAPIPDEKTLEARREELLATMQGYGKISMAYIENLVRSFSGLDAVATIAAGHITVALRAEYDRTIPAETIRQIILRRIPAHLSVEVIRMFTTWTEMENNFTWAQSEAAYTWNMLKNEKVVE